jgi:protein ImuB
MSRIVSVWLPRWPILRFLATQTKNPSSKPVNPDRPFVLIDDSGKAPRVAALNEAAEAEGIVLGEPLADARAKALDLQVRAVDGAADNIALRRLALWATRYTPTASPWSAENGTDGFFLDVEGAAHLFGGEETLLADLSNRLEKNFALPARIAIAATPGAAWALSRFHAARNLILPGGGEAEALSPLRIEALRLSAETCTTLRRLGFKTVGALLDKPRAPFAARFSAELLSRIDQAVGRLDEPLVPIVAPPVYHSLRYLLEPIITQEAVLALARRLMQTLTHVLIRDDAGARALRLSLYRVDGAVETIDVALTLPTRNVAHVVRLLDLKLEAQSAMDEAGFGFEAIGLAITRVEPMPAKQTEFDIDHRPEFADTSAASLEANLWHAVPDHGGIERCATLIDTLRQRLGPHSVRWFTPVASHIPERAEALLPVAAANTAKLKTAAAAEPEQNPRPLLLLPNAEPAEVMALIPDGPPRRFRWRGMTYEVSGAQGPERIASEWWRDPDGHRSTEPTRDYYLVEDRGGHRFWLYREGLYERETAAARWFVQGLFA